MSDVSITVLFRAPLAAAHVATTLLILSSAANAAVVESAASLFQFGTNCLAQGGKFTSDGTGGGGTCTKGNVSVYCTKATSGQGIKDSGIVCSVKTGGGSAAKLLRKLVDLPPRETGGNGQSSANDGGAAANTGNSSGAANTGNNGSNVSGTASGGPTKGNSGGCSGSVC